MQTGGPSEDLSLAGPKLARVAVFASCAAGTGLVAWIAMWPSGPGPRVFAPFPLLVFLPFFFSGELLESIPLALSCAAAISVGTYVLLLWPITELSRAPIPRRLSVCLTVATMLSVIWFFLGWDYGLQYQGAGYTCGVTIVNAALIGLLWCLRASAGSDASFGRRLLFGTLLLYWLFGSAFPYLGELP
jgi:hypothetical protein